MACASSYVSEICARREKFLSTFLEKANVKLIFSVLGRHAGGVED